MSHIPWIVLHMGEVNLYKAFFNKGLCSCYHNTWSFLNLPIVQWKTEQIWKRLIIGHKPCPLVQRPVYPQEKFASKKALNANFSLLSYHWNQKNFSFINAIFMQSLLCASYLFFQISVEISHAYTSLFKTFFIKRIRKFSTETIQSSQGIDIHW